MFPAPAHLSHLVRKLITGCLIESGALEWENTPGFLRLRVNKASLDVVIIGKIKHHIALR